MKSYVTKDKWNTFYVLQSFDGLTRINLHEAAVSYDTTNAF